MEYPAQVDMDLVCRVCMQIDEEMFWIFEEFSSETERQESVADMISECTMFKVDRYDKLPHLICGSCVNAVRQAFRFKRECEHSYCTMMELLGEQVQKGNSSAVGKSATIDIAIQTEDSAIYPCDRCDLKFFTFDTLRVHRRVCHMANAIICRYCAKTFNRVQTLKLHLLHHHQTEEVEALASDEEHEKPTSSCLVSTIEETKQEEEEVIEESETIDKKLFIAESSAEQHEFVKATDDDVSTSQTEQKYQRTNLTIEQVSVEAADMLSEQEESDQKSMPVHGDLMEVLLDDSAEATGDDDDMGEEFQMEDEEAEELEDGHSSSAASEDEGRRGYRRKQRDINKSQANAKSKQKRKRGRPRKEKPKSEFPYKCDICDKSFEHDVNLQRHRYHHNEIKQQRTCENCGKYFANEVLLQRHIKKAHETPTLIKCDECSEEFTLVKKYQRHKEKDHGAKFHDCIYCKKNFRSKVYLLRHMEKHSLKQYICRECTQGFTTKQELNEHVKAERHDRTILCPECGLRCKTSHELTAHRRSHNGEKPYKCKYCSKAFARMDALGMHEKYHVDIKSHFCGTCGKGFHRAYNLRVHERVHTGEKPYQCPHCPQAFKQGNDLKSHIRRHTGERFRCDICNAGFLQCYQMRQHKLNEHGIKEDAPTQRVAKFLSPEEQQEQINKQKELSELKPVVNENEEQEASEVLISIVWD